MTSILTLLIVSDPAFAAACDLPIPAALFDSKLQDTEEALQRKNIQSFTEHLHRLEIAIPCLVQPISPTAASKYHLLHGIESWLSKDLDYARLYFSAARAANSELGIPTSLYPREHQVQQLFHAAPVLSERMPITANGTLFFDGSRTKQRPTWVPTLIQQVEDGSVVYSAILKPGETFLPATSPTSSIPVLPHLDPGTTPKPQKPQSSIHFKDSTNFIEKEEEPTLVHIENSIQSALNSLFRRGKKMPTKGTNQ